VSKRKPLNERVRAHVERAGLSVSEIAKKSGWSYLRTLRLLNGDTSLSGDDMEVLARVLGREVGDLYEARV
jgi:transcriptional regulator with XRE-family HTH domain